MITSNAQERLRQQAIKDKEKERTQFYTEQAILNGVGVIDDDYDNNYMRGW